jgi:hypothetical protein
MDSDGSVRLDHEVSKMTNLTKLAAIALVALSASTTFASAAFVNPPAIMVPPAGPQSQPTVHRTPANLECKVRDADFYIINFGSNNIDSGREVAWSSPATDDDGVILLPRMLAPGDSVKLADVLSDFALPGAPCSAAFV